MTILRARNVLLLALAITIGLTVLALHQVGILASTERFLIQFLAPIQTGMSRIGQAASAVRLGLADSQRLRTENESLRTEVERLRSLVISLQEAENENRVLREQLGFAQASPTYDLLPARVIGRDPNNFIQTLIIDKGTRDGVREGKVVVAAGRVRLPVEQGDQQRQEDLLVVQGVVGTVIQAGPNYAKILLITDSSSAVNVMIQGSRSDGLLVGQGRGGLTLKYIRQGEGVLPGAVVLTSGLGGAFPRSLAVGVISNVQSKDQSPFQTASVVPVVDLARLDIVFVIRNFDPIRVGTQ